MSRPLQDTRGRERLPEWLKKSLAPGQEAHATDALVKEFGLHTICESGRCPNRDECYSQKTATFMIMGDICTRTCRFCSVSVGKPEILDVDEPRRVAMAAQRLNLKHVVVTSVNRDDLEDEGAQHFVEVIRQLRADLPDTIIEILTPDFKRTQNDAVRRILSQPPDIFNHNVETVERLYASVRPQAEYAKSLEIFGRIKSRSARVLTKSGIMVGLGETREEVSQVLRDLKAAGCEMLTIGQYLRSSRMGLPVAEYVHPDVFDAYKAEAMALGFLWVESAPFVRSSFHAKESFEALKKVLKERAIQGEIYARS